MVRMNPTHPNLHSTRLENLRIEPYGARFDLDGTTVQIRGDSRTPLVGALQALHRAALDEYQARRPEPKPGWFSRLKSWIGRVFGAGPEEGGRGAVAAHLKSAAAPEPARPRPIAETQPLATPAGASPALKSRSDPILRAVFADKDGVHMIWQPAPGKSKPREVAMTSSLDSQLAQRLQDCYGHLAELGYKVAGLELVRPAGKDASKPEAAPERAPLPAVAEVPVRHRIPRPKPVPAKEAAPSPMPEPGL
jgi:hypothetical protein